MTGLKPTTPLRRLTDSTERGESLVVELFPRHLTIRLKGKRAGYDLSYGAVYDLARKLAARKDGPR